MLQLQHSHNFINRHQSKQTSQLCPIIPFLCQISHRMNWSKLSIKSTPINFIAVSGRFKRKVLFPKYFEQRNWFNLSQSRYYLLMKILILHYQNRLLQIQINVQMEDANLDNVVSLVKTYTSDWKCRKSTEKKKGITRITGLSKQKYEKNVIIPIGLTNQNYNNSNYKYMSEKKQKIVCHQQVERGEIEKGQIQKIIKYKEPTALVQSHYINCQQDVEQWMKVKQKLQERINNLQIQNNFLKINVGIQQQYIIKIQTEVDSLRLKCQSSVVQASAQTQQQKDNKVSVFLSQSCQVQCDLQEKGFQQFQRFSKQVEEQTTEFFNLIKKLQDEKEMLITQNKILLQKLQKTEQRLQQQNDSRETIKNNLNKQISNLIETQYNLKTRLQSFEQSKQRMLNQVNQQNKLYEREKQLRIQMEKYKQAVLKLQREKMANLQTKYLQYKRQLDQLLYFLQLKSEEFITRNHNKQSEYKQKKDQINQYSERVSKIKSKIQSCFGQLRQYIFKSQSQNKQLRNVSNQVVQKEDMCNWQQKQKEIGQDIGYLLNKVATLQQLIDHCKRQNSDKQRQIHSKLNLLQMLSNKNSQLDYQNQTLKIQLQESTKQMKYTQHLITDLQDQKNQLKHIQYQLSEENTTLKTQLFMINQQLQTIKEKCNEDKMSVYLLRDQNQKQKEQIQQLTILLQNTSERFKRQLFVSQQQKNRIYFQKEELGRQLDQLKIQQIKHNNTVQSLRKQLFEMSHKYEQMAKAHAIAKRENVKLVQQGIQLKQKYEVIQRQIELITKSHRESLRQMEQHTAKLQKTLQNQRQLSLAQRNDWEKKKQLIKKDYDVLYNKYLKYKNIAQQVQPQH